MATEIHKLAVVSPKAELGEGVKVGPFTVIEDNVVIGNHSEIGPNVLIADGARLGQRVKIHKGAVISTIPQDLKFKGEETTLEIGDETVVREFCTLNRGTTYHYKTVIGSNSLLMAYVHVAHDTIVGDNVILVNTVQVAGHCVIEDWAIVGALCGVHQFTRIGAHAMIGAGFRIVKDVPPYVLAGREPLMAEKLNIIGLRRRGFSRETIDLLDNAFNILYRRGLNFTDACKAIESELPQTQEITHLVEFVKSSSRGLVRGPK